MNRTIVFVLSVLSFTAAASAQNTPTVLLDTTIGFGGLGYKVPTVFEGISFELPFHSINHYDTRYGVHPRYRFEMQSTVDGGSTRKEDTGDGHSFRARNQIVYWPIGSFGLVGGIGVSDLWTNQFHKTGITPLIGVVFRDHFGPANQPGTLAGRVYVSYLLPTGCQWSTNSNPCTIQSSRLQGIQVYPEWRIAQYLRLGIRMAVLHGLEQGNPRQPSAGRTGYITGDVDLVLRFQFPGAKYYEAY